MTTSEFVDVGGGVVVRPVVRADLLAVFRIEQQVFPQPWPFSAFERYLDAPAFLVADADAAATGLADLPVDDVPPGSFGRESDDADVVGYVVGDVVPNHGRSLGHVKDIAVHPDRRGEGVGSALLERALLVLAARGVSTVKLEVRPSNDAALAMYRRFGFERLKTVSGYYDDGEDAVVMILDLDASPML